jgi:muconolactone delta-isomerase
MQFIVVSTSTRDVTEFLDAEAERAGQLLASGVFLNVWPKADMTGAVVLAEASGKPELRQAVDSLPTVVAGATTYDVIALLDTGSTS